MARAMVAAAVTTAAVAAATASAVTATTATTVSAAAATSATPATTIFRVSTRHTGKAVRYKNRGCRQNCANSHCEQKLLHVHIDLRLFFWVYQ